MTTLTACNLIFAIILEVTGVPAARGEVVDRWMTELAIGAEMNLLSQQIADMRAVRITDKPLRYDLTGEIFHTQEELLAAIPLKEERLHSLRIQFAELQGDG